MGMAFIKERVVMISYFYSSNKLISLRLICFPTLILDSSVSGNLVLSQQKIYGLGVEK